MKHKITTAACLRCTKYTDSGCICNDCKTCKDCPMPRCVLLADMGARV